MHLHSSGKVYVMPFVLLLMLLLTACVADVRVAPSAVQQTSSTAPELINLNQELIDALARGDTIVADRIYANEFVRITTKGEVLTKAQVLSSLKAPKGGVKITYESKDIQVFDYGNAAVLVYLSIRHTDDKGQKSEFLYRVTDTFVRRDGRWQKAISAGTPVQSSSP